MSRSPALVTPRIDEPRANVLGVGIHALDIYRAVEILEDAIAEDRRGYVCVTGVHGVMEAQRDPQFRSILDDALLVTPDGMPTVCIGRWQGHRQMQRVFGPDLMLEMIRISEYRGYKHFLLGGLPGVAEELRSNLATKFPRVRILGTYTPPMRALSVSEFEDLQKVVARLAPDVIWVGLSTPKQERFMADSISQLSCKLMVGVGAAFDIHTGRVKDAPDWVKQAGLQWLHRLCQEPSRLWKRYLLNNSEFLVRIALQLAGLKKYELDA